MTSEIDFGSISGGFGRPWGAFWEDLRGILAPWGSSWKKYGQRDIFAKISNTIKMNFHRTWIWSEVFNKLGPYITKIQFWWLLCSPFSSLFDKTLRMCSKTQGWLSRICEELQPSLTMALKNLKMATTQFLNRTPALIRSASQLQCLKWKMNFKMWTRHLHSPNFDNCFTIRIIHDSSHHNLLI